MEQDSANSGIIDRSKVRSVLVEFVFQKFSQSWHVSGEDLVSWIEGAGQGNRGHAKSARWRDFQIAPKLLDRIAKIGLDTLGGGRAFAREQKCDVLSGEAQVRLSEGNRSTPQSPFGREREFEPDISAIAVSGVFMNWVERAGQSSFQCRTDHGRWIILESKEDIMGFQRFDHRKPVPRLNFAVNSVFATFAARLLSLAKNAEGVVNPIVRPRPQSPTDQPRVETVQTLEQVGIFEGLHGARFRHCPSSFGAA